MNLSFYKQLGIAPGTGTPPITASKDTGFTGLAYISSEKMYLHVHTLCYWYVHERKEAIEYTYFCQNFDTHLRQDPFIKPDLRSYCIVRITE